MNLPGGHDLMESSVTGKRISNNYSKACELTAIKRSALRGDHLTRCEGYTDGGIGLQVIPAGSLPLCALASAGRDVRTTGNGLNSERRDGDTLR